MRIRTRVLPALCLTLTIAAAGTLTASAHDGHQSSTESLPASTLAATRAATAAFHDPAAAIAAGYLPTDHCEPGMGQHWISPANLADGVNDLTKPDILLYEPTTDGLRLVGVEWMQPDADQDLSTDDDRPTLAGLPFDGPMLGHEPGMPVHYDKHLYLWKTNPDGAFTAHNPRVTC